MSRTQIGVVGSRNFSDLDLVADQVARRRSTCRIISGGARGVDSMAESIASSFKSYRPIRIDNEHWAILVVATGVANRTLPDYFPSFAAAAHFRNNLIIEESEELLIFWDGRSPGTRSVLDKVRKSRKSYTLFHLVRSASQASEAGAAG